MVVCPGRTIDFPSTLGVEFDARGAVYKRALAGIPAHALRLGIISDASRFICRIWQRPESLGHHAKSFSGSLTVA